jgi:hypothetical protein
VANFTGVEVASGIHATVRFGMPQRVTVTGPQALIARVVTEVVDGRLSVKLPQKSVRNAAAVEVEIISPKTNYLSVRDGAEVRAAEIASEHFELKLSRGSTVFMDGQVRALQLEVSSGATANLANLTAATAKVKMDGQSHSQVKAKQEIAGSLSNGAELVVLGKPAVKDVHADTGAKVEYP